MVALVWIMSPRWALILTDSNLIIYRKIIDENHARTMPKPKGASLRPPTCASPFRRSWLQEYNSVLALCLFNVFIILCAIAWCDLGSPRSLNTDTRVLHSGNANLIEVLSYLTPRTSSFARLVIR